MSTLDNLTNEECQLLVEILEREQRAVQQLLQQTSSREERDRATRRLETLQRLLWNSHVACQTPMPNTEELRQIGSYF
jgi:hypothetical protein